MNLPILLTVDGKYDTILKHVKSVIVEDEIISTDSGFETLTFVIAGDDAQRQLLGSEKEVEVDGRRYIIRVIEDLKNGSNLCTVTCDASWYDLNDGELRKLMWKEQPATTSKLTAQQALSQQLDGTGWTLGDVDIEGTKDYHTSTDLNPALFNIRQIGKIFGGELSFDTKRRSVNLQKSLGTRHQKIFCYEKNTPSIKRTVDTRDMFTRFSLVGKDSAGNDVTVADINGGRDYVEDYSWYDRAGLPRKIKWYRKRDDRFSNKENMLEYMNAWVASYCRPTVSYELKISMFEITPQLGDYVYVFDSGLGIGDWLRVVKRKKNILQPHLSTVELESVKKSIVNSMVSNSSSSQSIEDIVSKITTPDGQIRLPAGTEGWIMQFDQGAWKARPVVGNILPISAQGQVLMFSGNKWIGASFDKLLPTGSEGAVLEYSNAEWKASNSLTQLQDQVEQLLPKTATAGDVLLFDGTSWTASFQVSGALRTLSSRITELNKTVEQLSARVKDLEQAKPKT